MCAVERQAEGERAGGLPERESLRHGDGRRLGGGRQAQETGESGGRGANCWLPGAGQGHACERHVGRGGDAQTAGTEAASLVAQ